MAVVCFKQVGFKMLLDIKVAGEDNACWLRRAGGGQGPRGIGPVFRG